jgi:DNA-binding NarL/FixJ family response regulator
MIRVLFVEDEAWVRESVAELLGREDQATVVAAACGTAAEAIAKVAEGLSFDLGLVDLGLPDMSGVDLILHLRAARPDAILVAFTVYDDAPTVFSALRAGARGYLLKTLPPERLAPLLSDAMLGGAPLSPSIARMIIESFSQAAIVPAQVTSDRGLTPRETEVLTLLARGVTYAQAGKTLGIALGTVQAHVRRIYEKLEIGSKAEAAVVAAKLGFV